VCDVSGMGVAQLTLLRVLHARLQAELDARLGRSSKSGSRSSSCAGSKAGSRSGGGKAEHVRPHVSQSVAFGRQQQQAVGAQGGAGDLQFASADALACSAFAGGVAGAGRNAGGSADTMGLAAFTVAVQQPPVSPWLINFPPQPTGVGSAARPIDVEGVGGLQGCGKPCWVRPDGSVSEACCQEHVRQLAVARREARGGGLESPSLLTPAVLSQPAGQQASAAYLACGVPDRWDCGRPRIVRA
jgi:hypothetical protein